MGRHRKHFEERDHSLGLKENEINKVLSKNFGAFIEDRFEASPKDVKQALYIASVQGVTFSQELVKKVAEGMSLKDVSEGLIKSDDPHSFTMLQDGGEFRIKPYRDIIFGKLENFMDESEVFSAMSEQIEYLLRNVDSTTDRELEAAFNFVTNVTSNNQLPSEKLCQMSAELIRRKRKNLDIVSAGQIAKSVFIVLVECVHKVSFLDFRSILDADIDLHGVREQHAVATKDFISRLRHTHSEGSPIISHALSIP